MEKVVDFLRRHADFTAAAALFIVTLLFFLPGVAFEASLLDDTAYTGKEYLLFPTWENIIYHLKTPVLHLYSPLVMHSFMLDYAAFGRQIAQYHSAQLQCGDVLCIAAEAAIQSFFAG